MLITTKSIYNQSIILYHGSSPMRMSLWLQRLCRCGLSGVFPRLLVARLSLVGRQGKQRCSCLALRRVLGVGGKCLHMEIVSEWYGMIIHVIACFFCIYYVIQMISITSTKNMVHSPHHQGERRCETIQKVLVTSWLSPWPQGQPPQKLLKLSISKAFR